jgi:hypothetical protein
MGLRNYEYSIFTLRVKCSSKTGVLFGFPIVADISMGVGVWDVLARRRWETAVRELFS